MHACPRSQANGLEPGGFLTGGQPENNQLQRRDAASGWTPAVGADALVKEGGCESITRWCS